MLNVLGIAEAAFLRKMLNTTFLKKSKFHALDQIFWMLQMAIKLLFPSKQIPLRSQSLEQLTFCLFCVFAFIWSILEK